MREVVALRVRGQSKQGERSRKLLGAAEDRGAKREDEQPDDCELLLMIV